MPNRVRKQTLDIRNQTLSDLKRIYAAEWNEIDAEVERLVEQMYLDDEEATEAARQRKANKNGNKNRLIKLVVGAAIIANTKAINRINSGMDKIYTVNANDIAAYVLRKTGVEILTKDVQVSSLLDKYTKRRYNEATDNKYVSRQLMREINNMLTEGAGTKKIAQRLKKVYGFNRTSAIRTTRTETTSIQSRGRYDVMKEAGKQGFIFKKIWRHSHASKEPRDWHVSMDGETRDLDKPFSNGLMMPGEQGAPAEEKINCACYLDEELIGW